MAIGSPDTKYLCGLVRYTVKASSTAECPVPQDIDRGWFRRVHDICSEFECKGKDLDKLTGYGGVLVFALVCGIGWMASGLVAYAASIQPNKALAMGAGAMFTLLYLVFIGIFVSVWVSVKRMQKDCRYYNNKDCKDFRKKFRRSSREFLGYSICAFVLIFAAIICCFAGACSGGDDSPTKSEPQQEKPQDNYHGIPPAKSTDRLGNEAYGRAQKPEVEQVPKEPEVKAGTSGKKRYTGEEFKPKFKQLHKYINNPLKMQKYANKKFDETDKDNSGTLIVSEFKVFVTNILTRKGLPPPTDKKVDELMRYFDSDRSGTLEKNEFEKMLYEIFMESREILIRKYAVKKADSWKPERVPARKDTSELYKLDNQLNNSKQFYDDLNNVAVSKGYNRDSMMDMDSVVDLSKTISNNYKVPPLTKSEIGEIMEDIERPISEYNKNDQGMAVYAALAVSRHLMD